MTGPLTTEERTALRAAGSLVETMPAFEDRASTKTAVAYREMLDASLTVTQAAARLGVSESTVRRRLSARTLFGIRAGRGWRLPIVQFEESRELPGLAVVLPYFPADTHPLVVVTFLSRPHVDLRLNDVAVSPVDWLAAGADPAQVADAVADLGVFP
jgi:excisionase family DNA binding protein